MTAEQVARTYDTSIVVRRWLGAYVDLFVVLAIFLIPDLISNDFYRKGLPVWFALAIAYFPVMETLTGRTLGKYLTGTIVVDAQGKVPSVGQAFIRTILRVVEVNPVLMGGIPAGIAAALSKTRQRLGDMAAGTYVIRQQHVSLISDYLVQVPLERLVPAPRASWAVAARYLGLLSPVILPAPAAIVCGIMGLRQIRRNPELRGRGSAIFGIVAGTMMLAFLLWAFFMTERSGGV
jgi:uncharacterized RDD family membrane protein YckC